MELFDLCYYYKGSLFKKFELSSSIRYLYSHNTTTGYTYLYEQVTGDNSILLHNFVFDHHPCIYKKGNNLIKKYERMDNDFEYLSKKTSREYRLKTNLGSIYGDGSDMLFFLDLGQN